MQRTPCSKPIETDGDGSIRPLVHVTRPAVRMLPRVISGWRWAHEARVPRVTKCLPSLQLGGVPVLGGFANRGGDGVRRYGHSHAAQLADAATLLPAAQQRDGSAPGCYATRTLVACPTHCGLPHRSAALPSGPRPFYYRAPFRFATNRCGLTATAPLRCARGSCVRVVPAANMALRVMSCAPSSARELSHGGWLQHNHEWPSATSTHQAPPPLPLSSLPCYLSCG
jgi:hypothetical protein